MRLLLGGCALPLWLGTAAAAPPAEAPAPVTAPVATEPKAAEPSVLDASKDPGTPSSATSVVEAVLPCGLRVFAAQDRSLPVAAIVLAVEVGTEDDPDALPGLTHALAYHLSQGNRDLSPGGASQLVVGAGGLVGLAIGHAQTRFESVVPASLLDKALWIEAQRLRAPTVSEALWRDSLVQARRDPPRKWSVPRVALAAAHGGVTGLGRDGRQVYQGLGKLDEVKVGELLADTFSYQASTLVVVAPIEADAIVEKVERLFADLPERPRSIRSRAHKANDGEGPRRVVSPNEAGNRFVWPVPPTSEGAAWATVLCRTINRQRRAAGEARKARVRCRLEQDPRRAVLVLRATGPDDVAEIVQARLDRIREGRDRRLVDAQRRAVRRELRLRLRTPLALARRVAAASSETVLAPGHRRARDRDRLTALESLENRDGLSAAVPGALSVTNSVRLVSREETE